jgi:nucleotide-binding universal stress UspA family protein
MLPLKKILCPTDFSEPSYEALKVAEELALHFSAEILLLYVIPSIPLLLDSTLTPATFDIASYEREIEKGVTRKLEEVIENKTTKKVKITSLISDGEPASEIKRVAEVEDVDLIVISTHGRKGWDHLLSGSVTEKVVKRCTNPTLIVRRPKED